MAQREIREQVGPGPKEAEGSWLLHLHRTALSKVTMLPFRKSSARAIAPEFSRGPNAIIGCLLRQDNYDGLWEA